MLNSYLVKKGKMQQVYLEDGRLFGITILHSPPATILQVKDNKKDGYQALQLAFGEKKRAKKAILGHIKKSGSKIPARIKEIRLAQDAEVEFKVGDQITIDQILEDRDIVKATGTSKGRGFAGVIKRHGFHSQPATHGASDRERAPGSIGAQTPGKVIKGKKMPGHMGNATISVKNLKVLKVDKEQNQIWIIGSVPGHINSWIEIKKTNKKAADTFKLPTPPKPQKEEKDSKEKTDKKAKKKTKKETDNKSSPKKEEK